MKCPSSLTHLHLLSILHTELVETDQAKIVRILDLGCGDGKLIAYLSENLGELVPDLKFEVYGLEVIDRGIQQEDFFADTIAALKTAFPTTAWDSRLVGISVNDDWPFENGFFDFIVSNQVLEHVQDLSRVFSETNRVLLTGGQSINLFPLKECLFEPHLFIPIAHRVLDWRARTAWIRMMSRIGLGKFRSHKDRSISVSEYADRQADYIEFYTNYSSRKELLALSKSAGLRGCFIYTQEFYWAKIRSVLRFEHRYLYRRKRVLLFDWLCLLFLKRVASVTFVLEKRHRNTRISGESQL